ncbi:serine hydrolase [Candidatus Woesebacteria bacterium]|nr:MAG: serine hydrolase [Candidatus Woesebacteria bacterium]
MGIIPFGSKKAKPEEEVDDEIEEKPRRKKRSPDEPKKKIPPKPWGKKERIVLLIILLVTAGSSGVLAMSAREFKLPGLPRIILPDVSKFNQPLSFVGDETIVIEGNSSNKIISEEIIKHFNIMTNDLSGVYGFYIIHTEDNYSFGVNVQEKFEPASLNKLAVILTAYSQYEKGDFDIDEDYVLKASDKIGGSGSLSTMPNGTVLTYRELLTKMGKASDNTAFNVVRRTLGDAIIAETTRVAGMNSTSLDENATTVKDIGQFFISLYKGNLVTSTSQKAILDSLTDTTYENWITQGVPPEVRVAHKFGREVHVVNDAGIVYADKPYILVVMSKGIIESEADDFFPRFSKIVYDIENKI